MIFELEIMIIRNMIDIAERIQYLDFESIDTMMKFMHKWYMISIMKFVGYKIPPAEVRDRNDPSGILPTSDLR